MADDALYALESEACLLGAGMYAPEACEDAFELSPERFGVEVHGLIWKAIRDIRSAGGRPSPEIVRDRIGANPQFLDWGGYGLLFELWNRADVAGIADHVAAVDDRATRRDINALIARVAPRVADTAAGPAVEILADVEREAAQIAQGSAVGDRWINAGELIRRGVAHARARSGRIDFPFGPDEVDALVGGLNPGEVTLLAGRPGMGKTLAAQAVARANASRGQGVCFFSLEMSDNPLGLRLASDIAFDRSAVHYSGVSTNPTADGAMKHQLTASQWALMDDAASVVDQWPLLADTRPGLTMAQIEAAARRQIRRWARAGTRPGPVIIDHLGKVRPSKDRRGAKHAEMADVSGDVAEMAKRLGVPVLALVQLNRGVESREDKRPQLSDLRQAGELEEDARQVIFMFRPEYYLRDGPDGETFEKEVERKAKLREVEKKLYWLVAKNSHGPLGQALTYCDVACSAIRSWEP